MTTTFKTLITQLFDLTTIDPEIAIHVTDGRYVAVFFLSVLTIMWFLLRRSRRYLHLLQQDDYDTSRFLRLIRQSKWFDFKLLIITFTLLITSTLVVFVGLSEISKLGFQLRILNYVVVIVFALNVVVIPAMMVVREPDPRRSAKKALVMTPRARRLLATHTILCLIGFLSVIYLIDAVTDDMLFFELLVGSKILLGWIIITHILPLILALSKRINDPLEARIRQGFQADAEKRLAQVNPRVIGITGSFGKTSVKHILTHILDGFEPSLCTPGSVNTIMGISRIIRTELTENHSYFIVEMGAYGPGSIRRLCEFAKPSCGLIISIGKAHLERFNDLETTAAAKYELCDYLQENAKVEDPISGLIVVAASTTKWEAAQVSLAKAERRVIVNDGDTIVKEADVTLSGCTETTKGLSLDISIHGETTTVSVPLHGEHQAQNVVLSFAAARSLGVPESVIVHQLGSVPQIAHRLERKPYLNGSILLDDAYNSNPEGFASALKSLSLFGGKGKKRILVSPGMVELGQDHDLEHKRIGSLAAESADIFLAINPENIEPMIDAYSQGNGTVIKFDDFVQAYSWMVQNVTANDAVLIENDLPDIYDRSFVF